MTASLGRTASVAALVLLGAAACAGPAPQWTFAPVASTEAEVAEGSLPAASDNPELPDEAPPEASPVLESGAPDASEPSVAPAPSAPTGSEAPAGSEAPEGAVIEIVATGSLSFTTPDGEKTTDIPVTPGGTVTFRVDNVANFDHNFHIGTDAELSVAGNDDLPGIPTWTSGVQELVWSVPDDVTGLKFGCTVPGHYSLMQGTFSVAS
jgi:hypothetical protein